MPRFPSSNVAVRRSRRLSQQKPVCFRDTYSDEHWEEHSDLLSEPPSSSSSSSSSPSSSSHSAATSPEPQFPHHSGIQYQPERVDQNRSHSRRRSASHIPRPANAFILFRSAFWRRHKAEMGKTDHRMLSKDVGSVWNAMLDEDKEPFEELARSEKKRHQERYPDWKYSPKGTKGESERYSAAKRNAAKRKPAVPTHAGMQPLERLDEPMETSGPKLEYLQLPISAVKQEQISSPVISLPKPSSSSDLDAAEFTRTEDIPPLVLGELQYPGLLPRFHTPGGFDLYGDVNGDLSPSSHSQFYDPYACVPVPMPEYPSDASYYSSPCPLSSFGFSDPWTSEGSSSASSSPGSLSKPLHSDALPFSLTLSPKSLVEDILAMPMPMPISDFSELGLGMPMIHAPVASQYADLAMLEFVNFS